MKPTFSYTYLPSIDDLVARIEADSRAFAVVAISGFGGAGKSTLASALGGRLGAPVVSIDEFGTPGALLRSDNWSGFDRLRLIQQLLGPIAAGARTLTYDSCDDWDSWQTASVTLTLDRHLILEGVGLFLSALLPYLNWRLWLDVPLAVATARGKARARALGREVEDLWHTVWEPNERAFACAFQPRGRAHILVRS